MWPCILKQDIKLQPVPFLPFLSFYPLVSFSWRICRNTRQWTQSGKLPTLEIIIITQLSCYWWTTTILTSFPNEGKSYFLWANKTIIRVSSLEFTGLCHLFRCKALAHPYPISPFNPPPPPSIPHTIQSGRGQTKHTAG